MVGFEGKSCDRTVEVPNACDPNPCLNGGSCTTVSDKLSVINSIFVSLKSPPYRIQQQHSSSIYRI